jgi:hypothetical protein
LMVNVVAVSYFSLYWRVLASVTPPGLDGMQGSDEPLGMPKCELCSPWKHVISMKFTWETRKRAHCFGLFAAEGTALSLFVRC